MVKFTKIVFDLQNRLIKNSLPIAHVNLIAEYVLKDTMSNLLVNDELIEQSEYEKMIKVIEIFESEKIPIPQIVGFEYFFEHKFFVSDKCLIPRIETEELVYNTIEFCKNNYKKGSSIKVYDCCCGSGAIGISIYLELCRDFEIDLCLSDLSSEALVLCHKNLLTHNVKAKISTCSGVEKSFKNIDIFVSNPPYIPKNEDVDMLVKNHEPHVALFGGEEGLDVYYEILDDVIKIMTNKFFIGFEHGTGHHEVIKKLLCSKNSEVKCVKNFDMFDRERNTFATNFGIL